MTMTNTPQQQQDTVPGVQISMTRRDFYRLIGLLRELEMSSHMAFTQGTDIPGIVQPLYTAQVAETMRETIEANSSNIPVPARLAANVMPHPGGGIVYPNQIYTVRREIGQYDKMAPVAKWVWTVDSYTTMTGAEFRAYDIPAPTENRLTMTRCRIQLLDDRGKILRERFGY